MEIAFVLFACIVPLVLLGLLGVGFYFYRKQEQQLQQAQQKHSAIQKTLSETGGLGAHEILQKIDDLERKRQEIRGEVESLNSQIAVKKSEIIILDDEALLQSFGFYKPKYGLENSEAYKHRLDQVRAKQAEMIKGGRAAFGSKDWTVNNNKKEGERMVKDYVKIILRSFNDECDSSIANVKFSNMASVEKKIQKSFEALNKLGQRMSISLSPQYLNLKLEELYLVHEYQVKKQDEKEEQKRLREQMREEVKAMREIEELKMKIEKEETHFNKAIVSLNEQIQRAKTEAERGILEKEKSEIEKHLIEIEKDKLDVLNREKNTRAGYVYIISNIGSFGENVYKIGVTRRLDPTERVDELGDASVPFNFDIHATIFSDDAPALENALHKAFAHRRLNLVNLRREFFEVTLDEIEEVVKKNFNKPFEFTRLADAEQYRESEVLRKQPA